MVMIQLAIPLLDALRQSSPLVALWVDTSGVVSARMEKDDQPLGDFLQKKNPINWSIQLILHYSRGLNSSLLILLLSFAKNYRQFDRFRILPNFSSETSRKNQVILTFMESRAPVKSNPQVAES